MSGDPEDEYRNGYSVGWDEGYEAGVAASREARELLANVYAQAALNRGYVSSALLNRIRTMGLGS